MKDNISKSNQSPLPWGGDGGGLQTVNLKRTFTTEEVRTIALNGVNIEVSDGEFVAIMGPSGCGKSTLLNILGLLDAPTEGQYLLCGQDVSHLSEPQRDASYAQRIINLYDGQVVQEVEL